MSRRIQIYLSENETAGGVTFKEIGVVVYGPAGKAELFHDIEVVLMACADVLNGGSGTARHQWTVNEQQRDRRSIRNAATIIQGWDRDTGCAFRSDKEVSRTLILDAGEAVWRGEVSWFINTPARTPEQIKVLGRLILTPAETLRFIAETLLKTRT